MNFKGAYSIYVRFMRVFHVLSSSRGRNSYLQSPYTNIAKIIMSAKICIHVLDWQIWMTVSKRLGNVRRA